MQTNINIASAVQLGSFLEDYLSQNTSAYPSLAENLDKVIAQSEQNNPWFTQEFQRYALRYWANHLKESQLENWLSLYSYNSDRRTIGLVLAGNIPMVGFHDVLCVLLSGNKAQIKLSSKDPFLIPFILEFWHSIEEDISFEFVDMLENFDAVIATGSDNSAMYFSQYFSEFPHIIRKNRTSIAVLDGKETEEELKGLAEDIFTYFGLGCRNVTQLWLPKCYDKDLLFQAFYSYHPLIQHTKYYNSYEYQRAIYLLNKDEFWDNNFLLIKKSDTLFAPVAVVNYMEYESLSEVDQYIKENSEKIQIIVSHSQQFSNFVNFGSVQNPTLNSYADGVDVMTFLTSLS